MAKQSFNCMVSMGKGGGRQGELVLLGLADGCMLQLIDVAKVQDSLSESILQWRQNGLPTQGGEIHT